MEYCGKTDIGKKRNTNQDCFRVHEFTEELLLVVVCDGMGGAHGGETASVLAADAFMDSMCSFVETHMNDDKHLDYVDSQVHRALRLAAFTANKAVCKRAADEPSLRGMGTTLVGALIVKKEVFAVNVGDSRLYLVSASDSKAQQVTKDHSYVQFLVDIGRLTPEEARTAPNRNIITRAIGDESSAEADIFMLDADEGEDTWLLFCSDGLSNYLEDTELADVLTSEETTEGKVDLLIERANLCGGADNITAVVVRL